MVTSANMRTSDDNFILQGRRNYIENVFKFSNNK
jgi:hypothetical protein